MTLLPLHNDPLNAVVLDRGPCPLCHQDDCWMSCEAARKLAAEASLRLEAMRPKKGTLR